MYFILKVYPDRSFEFIDNTPDYDHAIELLKNASHNMILEEDGAKKAANSELSTFALDNLANLDNQHFAIDYSLNELENIPILSGDRFNDQVRYCTYIVKKDIKTHSGWLKTDLIHFVTPVVCYIIREAKINHVASSVSVNSEVKPEVRKKKAELDLKYKKVVNELQRCISDLESCTKAMYQKSEYMTELRYVSNELAEFMKITYSSTISRDDLYKFIRDYILECELESERFGYINLNNTLRTLIRSNDFEIKVYDLRKCIEKTHMSISGPFNVPPCAPPLPNFETIN